MKNFLAHETPSFCPNLCTGSTLWLISRSPVSNTTTHGTGCLPSRVRSALSFTTKDYDTLTVQCKLNIFKLTYYQQPQVWPISLADEAEDVTQSNHGKLKNSSQIDRGK